MTLPRTAADVLAKHVVFEVESIDRLYLNLYVPDLQRVGQVVGFLTRHLGFELVDGAFDNVALLVDLAVEPRWPPTRAAPPQPVLLLVRGFGDGGLDPASAHADPAAGVGLIAQHSTGSCPWPAGSSAADPDRGHHRP